MTSDDVDDDGDSDDNDANGNDGGDGDNTMGKWNATEVMTMTTRMKTTSTLMSLRTTKTMG